MNDEYLLELLKDRIPLKDREGLNDEFFSSLLPCAKHHIMKARFPYDEEKRKGDVEESLKVDQIEVAIRIFNKIGAEGDTSHSEAGIARTYYDPSGFKDILDNIIPYCGVL